MTWLLLSILAGVVSYYLGMWQWGRYESKSLLQHQVSDNYNATPKPIGVVLPTEQSTLNKRDKWTQVKLTGSYDSSKLLLVRNRPNDTYYGYEVVIPFEQTDGSTVLVDRGWIPNGNTAAAPNSIPPTPSGTVTVIGWVQPGEANEEKKPVPGQVASINIPEIEQITGETMYSQVYVLMRSETTASGASPARPDPLPAPDPGSYAGINFSYALQWWAAMIGGVIFVLERCRREHDEMVNGPRAKRPKKVRIWDEEDA